MDISNVVTFILERVLPDMSRAIRETGACQSAMAPGLVFVHTKASAEGLAAELSERLSLEVPWVTSDVSEERREAVAQGLRDGLLPMAVCTDAWSTGIDIPSLRWVALEAWTRAPIGLRQRAGRGARLASGKTDFAIYVLPGGRYEREVRAVLEGAEAAVPYEPGNPMAILRPRRLRQPRAPRQQATLSAVPAAFWTSGFLLWVALGAIAFVTILGSILRAVGF